MTRSFRTRRILFDLAVVLLALLALLPIKRLTVETGCLGDQTQAGRDTIDFVGLISADGGPQFSAEAAYLFPAPTISFYESPVVSTLCYRGPPAFS